jgi:hypothetical protein
MACRVAILCSLTPRMVVHAGKHSPALSNQHPASPNQGISAHPAIAHPDCMRSCGRKNRFPAVLILLMSSLPLSASMTSASLANASTHPPLAPINIQSPGHAEEGSELQSLRRDVATHPNDFISFETEFSANRFIAEHAPEAQRESQPRVIARGIFGYWRGKTMVVLPSLSAIIQR